MNDSRMAGKRVIITGANSGIGRVTALELAKAGAEVVLVCRSAGRGEHALAEIRRESGSSSVSLMLCDLASSSSIRAFGTGFREKYDRLDVLVNNAGAYLSERRESETGLEMTFALNHMGYFRLVKELEECLRAAGSGRIVNVSSMGHRFGRPNWEDLQWKRRRYRPLRAYCDSKLMNILFTRELARRMKDSGVTANSLHPGTIRSGFAVRQNGWFSWLVRLVAPFLSSPERGARTSVFLACSAEVEGLTGGYYVNRRLRRPSRLARSEADAARLWELSEALLETSAS